MKKEVYNQSICLINEVAYLYYIKQLPVVTIANKLHVSQSTVSRSIKRAKKEQIITFNMNRNALSCIQMEQRIKEQFSLKNCFVVPSFSNTFISEDPIKVKKRVALEGARYLQRIVNDDDIIGIAWGRTMYHLIHYLNPCQRRGSKIVTLHGSIENVNPKFNVDELAHRAAMAFGGKQFLLTHRGILTEQEFNEVHSSDYYETFNRYFNATNVSISSVGVLYPAMTTPLMSTDYLNFNEIQELQSKHAYCDFLLRFLDQDGNELDTTIKQRTNAITLEQYRKIPLKIVVTAGAEKVYAVRALLKGNLIDVLILDQFLANALFALDSE